jgi:hypothetical protein
MASNPGLPEITTTTARNRVAAKKRLSGGQHFGKIPYRTPPKPARKAPRRSK